MKSILLKGAIGCVLVSLCAATTWATDPVLVTARAGAVDGTKQNSDEFIWRLFTQFAAPAVPGQASPVVFETWASDADTFASQPHWPLANAPKRLQASVLGAVNRSRVAPVDVPCNQLVSPPPANSLSTAVGNAAVAGFPISGPPTPCIAEEVRRNRPQFDYIVNNKLNTQAGLADAFAKSFKVVMPTSAVSIKGDWVPVQTLLQWIPAIGSLDQLRTLYYTGASNGVEYALVSLHVSSRQNANWVWGTFEHQMSPGRCDDLGCYDSFGAAKPVVRPNRTGINTQYGECNKSAALSKLMRAARLSPMWQNYCMKSTQVDYTAPDGTPTALGNSVIERAVGNGTVAASSCIACHAYASFGATGAPTAAATAMLPYNPTGRPIPAVLQGSLQFDFMWGVLLAPAK
jgi:hypothetical protein